MAENEQDRSARDDQQVAGDAVRDEKAEPKGLLAAALIGIGAALGFDLA